MAQFIVSARKYRPAAFESVVGQQAITLTLKNAIKKGNLAHAFLFCGPRGVGKTTCARILAKTINCQNLSDDIEACNECESCLSFNDSASFNIRELDAASNNSVEDIQNLIEQVRYLPQVGKYSIFIIDEVHMLSQTAFNAFLKTLEEPPAHVKFILATTEKHKILPTILSRCQIFHFNRIQIPDIAGHLEKVAQQEGIVAQSDALHIIAQKADGALRDALSIFDQIALFSEGNITYRSVIENLNILDYDYYFKVVDYTFSGNYKDCLLLFNEVITKGFDGHLFINGLSGHLRNILICRNPQLIKLLEVGENIQNKYSAQSSLCNDTFLLDALNMISKSDIGYKSSNNQRLHVELLLLNLCTLSPEYSRGIRHAISQKEVNEPEEKISLHKKEEQEEHIVEISEKEKATEIKTSVDSEKKIPEVPQSEAIPTEVDTEQKAKPVSNNDSVEEKDENIEKSSTAKAKYRPQTISLDSLGNATKHRENITSDIQETKKTIPTDTFTMEEAGNAILEYAKLLEAKGEYHLFSTITKYPLEREENVLKLKLDNKPQEEKLASEKTNLLSFIREKLNNYLIQFQTEVVEVKEKELSYTPFDKYKKMAEKNADLNKLKQQLDLDIIF